MAIHAAIKHSTGYTYDRLVTMSPQVIRLRPAPHTRTPVVGYSIKIYPENHFINWQQDPFGNYLARIVFPDQIKEFRVDVEVIIEMKVINPFDFFMEESADKFPFSYHTDLKKELAPYLEVSETGPQLEQWVEEIKSFYGLNTVDFLVSVNQKLYQQIAYTIRLETGIQSPDETLTKALGSCRDSAWVLVQALRHLGLATRFVSGYLVQLKPDKKSVDGASGPEEDFTDLHAWCEVYIPGAGWIGLDSTSGLFAGEGHIPLCCTPEPASASPITGFTTPAEVKFSYANQVFRIHEDPRITKPYSDDEWQRIHALGEFVEDKLHRNDVRLTMGGEPTVVSIKDMESEQWNTNADGEDKRKMAFELADKLSQAFGKGNALIHIGQGKWYPGEPVPRWQYGIYWRKDGLPLVNDARVYGDPNEDYGYTFKQAEGLMKEITLQLKLPLFNVQPAYEDVYYYLWQEDKLPININPLRVNLSDSLERKTMSGVIKNGLNNPVGFVLPLEWNFELNSWLSCAWEFRQKQLYLVPGNSPMGLRLPLESLPHMVPAQRKQEVERSLFEELGNLPDYHNQIKQQQQSDTKSFEKIPKDWLYPKEKNEAKEGQKDEGFFVVKKKKEEKDTFEPEFRAHTIKTALGVEARNGALYVFFPPFKHVEQYLELLAIVEAAAAKLSLKVLIEGYEPPRDNRIEKLVVTPDPGVIEINIHPAKSWKEVTRNYDILFRSAEQVGLGTEKFMLDGRHIGSGGGHHITLGGTTPADSPLLRKPGVLKSFLIFWQNHPGLSYLFSGAFIGPTSQAPRIDEGKPDQLYELEIALNQIEEGEEVPFWLVDRLLRNILVDITGNTHRAEFCIDKLYSPDSSTGRLGILELRAFEMPPDERMCVVQLLLVRTLFAWFWEKPYKQKLIRWGTELHDKFMLHHYVKEDMLDICEQLNSDGFSFNPDWLEPFFEFRFPLVGRIQKKGINLSLRTGIEPWQVLGEEMSSTGTARFVDSSVERIELKVSGLNEERYAILCNAQRVPVRSTERNEEFVAGIRYKAWAPPSALHPTIPVDVPLVFDIYDLWNKKSIGGCTYYVSHPGGRNYDTYPVNAYEAESRRESRFFNFGHSQGDAKNKIETKTQLSNVGYRYVDEQYSTNIENVPMVKPETDKEFPYTFDLRRSRKSS
ncbi:transglutaminase family protein [Reichenbachiella carrageenanivorans]|uniref:Transglutaminase family protein n=1 Tax=Reichenbachiella carrageenanivorans TaxID=2979869 RepID=A0ABY6D0N9_9BACT|nr:transglutaminase family protein [Reichenbachiella carrageenanivorans]UXX78628.1 transglutaminase family protein [Reichenbachiella carrageenanivorans]